MKRRELNAGGAAVLVATLTACAPAAPAPSHTPLPTTSASASDAPSDQERFATQGDMVLARYPSAAPAGDFSGSQDETVTLPAAQLAAPVEVVLLLTCTGDGDYSVTVEQTNPNTVGAACGTVGTSIAAVPLDDPSAATTLRIDVPDASDFWLSAYYAPKKG